MKPRREDMGFAVLGEDLFGLDITRLHALGTVSGMGEISHAAPAIAPTLGSELLTDPGFENWTNPTTPTNWTKNIAGSTTVNQETTVIRSGSNSLRLDVDAGGSGFGVLSSAVLAVGTWFQSSVYMRNSTTGKSARIAADASHTGSNVIKALSNTTFEQVVQTGRVLSSPVAYSLVRQTAASSSIYWDDASLKALTFSTCISRMGNPGHKNGTFQCTPTVTAGAAAGILFNYLNENNFSMIYLDGVTAFLVSRIAGTYTTVKSGAITYVAGRVLKCIVNGTTVQLFYNGIQVGTNGTINNSGMGTEVWAFSTYASNTVGTVTTSRVVS